MNAIVAGKQEKVAGTMVFKVEQSADLNNTNDIYFTFSNAADWNHKYLRIIESVYHTPCYIIKGDNMSVNRAEPSIVQLLTRNFSVLALSQGYRWAIYNPGIIQNWSVYADAIEVGTLEVS